MDNVFTPIITDKGLEVLSKLQAKGKAYKITHVALGSGASYVPSGQETRLKEEQQRVLISDCQWIENGKNGQIHIKAVADNNHKEPYDIHEVGFILEGENNEEILFALYTTGNSPKLAYKNKEADVLLAFDLVLGIPEQDIKLLIANTRTGEGFSYPIATAQKPGIVPLATSEQVKEGKNDTAAITSLALFPVIKEIKTDQAQENQNVQEKIKNLNTRLDSFGQVPVGAIVDYLPTSTGKYWQNGIPRGFVFCDGRIITDETSDYFERKIPNFGSTNDGIVKLIRIK